MHCRHVSFSADEEMRFQALCKSGHGQCRQLRTGSSKVAATNGCGRPLHIKFACRMAYRLSNKCAKDLCKRTVLVQLIIRNVVKCLF